MVLRAADGGWRIAEIDVDYHPRDGQIEGHRDVKGTVRADARHDECLTVSWHYE